MAVAVLAVSNHRIGRTRPTFVEVADAHLDAVFRYLRQMTGDQHLAEDLTSETFERALRAWDSYDPARGPVLPWLLAICRRIALDHFRADTRRRRRERSAAAMAATATEPPDPGGLGPELSRALAGLTRGEREVVALRVLLDLDGPVTARLMGISTSACSTQLHRAMTKLRAELGQ